MKGNLEWFQRLQRPPDINFWTAGYSQMEVQKFRRNKILNELRYLFMGRQHP